MAQPRSVDNRWPVERALRLLSAGSVDDGKSTLIGRLLLDANALFEDELDGLRTRAAGAPMDLSTLTDGLVSEREERITIDLGHRYFSTPERRFIIADAPGHQELTANMITGASSADAAVILVDLTKLGDNPGERALLSQTRKHALLCHWLGVPTLLFALNKIDAVPDPERAVARARAMLTDFCLNSGARAAGMIPLSALTGEGALTRSPRWPDSPSLMEALTRAPLRPEHVSGAFLMPVDYHVPGPQGASHGRVARGAARIGDAVEIWGAGPTPCLARIESATRAGREAQGAQAGESIALRLQAQSEAPRCAWIAAPGSITPRQSLSARVCWFGERPMAPGQTFLARHGARWVQARVESLEGRLSPESLSRGPAKSLAAQEMGYATLHFSEPIPALSYASNRVAGALALVDERNRTCAAALID